LLLRKFDVCRELIWAIYAAIEAMESTNDKSYHALAAGWTEYLDYLKTTVAKVSKIWRHHFSSGLTACLLPLFAHRYSTREMERCVQ
jgi:hypothetical protein